MTAIRQEEQLKEVISALKQDYVEQAFFCRRCERSRYFRLYHLAVAWQCPTGCGYTIPG